MLSLCSVHRGVLRVINEGENLASEHIYFSATPAFLGDKTGAYGQPLTFAIRSLPAIQSDNVTREYGVERDGGDIILEGALTPFTLVSNLSLPMDERRHNFTVSAYVHVNMRR